MFADNLSFRSHNHSVRPPLPFVLAHTGVIHSSDAVHKPLRERWLEGGRAVREGYERIQRIGQEGKKALLLQNWERLGWLMNENHAIQRGLGGSGPQNEVLIDAAVENGALGAKLAGAGQGGTVIALTLEPDRTVRALRAAGAERILWPRPCVGLMVEATSQHQLIPLLAS